MRIRYSERDIGNNIEFLQFSDKKENNYFTEYKI